MVCDFLSGLMSCLKSDSLRLCRRSSSLYYSRITFDSVSAIYVQNRRHIAPIDDERIVHGMCGFWVSVSGLRHSGPEVDPWAQRFMSRGRADITRTILNDAELVSSDSSYIVISVFPFETWHESYVTCPHIVKQETIGPLLFSHVSTKVEHDLSSLAFFFRI